MKQIGLAFHNHHDQRTFLPTDVNGQPVVGTAQQAGWGFQFLPFVEGDNGREGGSASTDLDRALAAVTAVNKVFFGPTRRTPDRHPELPRLPPRGRGHPRPVRPRRQQPGGDGSAGINPHPVGEVMTEDGESSLSLAPEEVAGQEGTTSR